MYAKYLQISDNDRNRFRVLTILGEEAIISAQTHLVSFANIFDYRRLSANGIVHVHARGWGRGGEKGTANTLLSCERISFEASTAHIVYMRLR